MLEKLKHPVVLLLVKFGALYLIWFLFYDVWLRSPSDFIPEGETAPENTSELDNWVITKTTATSAFILKGLGYEVFYDGARTIGIAGTGGLWVGDACNAITLIALFTGLIICFSGIWWHKLIFIIAGSLIIWILNVFRLVFLSILDTQSRYITEFNHTYTFTIIVYACIILMWYLWIRKFADLNTLKDGQKN